MASILIADDETRISGFIDKGLRAVVEKRLARFSDILGWRPDFPVETLMVSGKLKLEEHRPLKPFGFFTLLRFQRLN